MFRVPNGQNQFQKLEKLNFDKNKKTAIYKFTNDQSHMTGDGFDPSLVPETQKNVQYLLEMMKEVFPEHYEILEEQFSS
jgi:arabinogalactan endo-1,4-beta-galactosidase